MADISTILHLRLDEMGAMSLTELAEWRERARIRSGAEE